MSSIHAHYMSFPHTGPKSLGHLDTAGTNHMTSDHFANLSLNSTPYGGEDHVKIGDGSFRPFTISVHLNFLLPLIFLILLIYFMFQPSLKIFFLFFNYVLTAMSF